MSTKPKKWNVRETTQARVSNEWYSLIKLEAKEEQVTVSKYLDKIFLAYFGKRGWRKAKKLSRKTVRPERPLLE